MPDDAPEQFLRDPNKKFWSAVDRLQSKLDAAAYNCAVPGLIFLTGKLIDAVGKIQSERSGPLPKAAQNICAATLIKGLVRRWKSDVAISEPTNKT